jgi:hypothetical protein
LHAFRVAWWGWEVAYTDGQVVCLAVQVQGAEGSSVSGYQRWLWKGAAGGGSLVGDSRRWRRRLGAAGGRVARSVGWSRRQAAVVAWSSRRKGSSAVVASWQGGTEGSGGQQGVRVAWSGRGCYIRSRVAWLGPAGASSGVARSVEAAGGRGV